MKILIVSATLMEVKLLVEEMIFVDERSHFLKHFQFDDCEVDILISGIGTTATSFHLTNTLKDFEYQYVINIGIAGSFTHDLNIGDVVNVVSEEFADLGIEKENEFLTLFETGYVDFDEFPFNHGILKATDSNGFFEMKQVKGITSNKSHGEKSSIDHIKNKFTAQVESMEGAAVFYVCNWLGIPCYQIRAVSNYVEPRDSAQWNIPLALENLKNAVLLGLKKISVPVS